MAVKKTEIFEVENVQYVSVGYWYKNTSKLNLTLQGDGFKVEFSLLPNQYKEMANRMASIVKEMEGVEVESD